MRYENRQPTEGLNTPKRHPLREFLRLLLLAITAVAVLVMVLNVSGGRLGGLMPFTVELWVAEKVDHLMVSTGQSSPFAESTANTPMRQYLKRLSRRVTDALELDADIPITLHYIEDDLINAFATVGGHVYLHRGLLRLLPHENALAMLIAHEVSHVSLRHPARGLGSGLAVAIGTAVLPAGTSLQGRLYELGGSITQMSFSRSMESQADRSALQAIHALYGHVRGAADLFVLFAAQKDAENSRRWERFFSTHPLDEERISAIAELAAASGWSSDGALIALPEGFSEWLE